MVMDIKRISLSVATAALVAAAPLAFPAAAQDASQNATEDTGQKAGQTAGQKNKAATTAQTDTQVSNADPAVILDINAVYANGISARSLYYDTDVAGPDDSDIGSVENVIFAGEGKVAGLIVEVGGFWDIGDQHLFVPWEQIELMGGGAEMKVKIPVTEETAEDYTFSESGLYKSSAQSLRDVNLDWYTVGPKLWRVSEVIGDYAYLSDRQGYGFIRDVIVSPEGDVRAVIINAQSTYGGGYRAFPYRGTRYTMGPYYSTGYSASQVMALPEFDYERLAQQNN